MEDLLIHGLYVFVLLNLLDFMTTYVGIAKLKARELNPVARLILKRLGWVGLHAYKMTLTGLLPLLSYIMTQDVTLTVWVWNIILAITVAWNSFQTARRVRGI